MAEVAAAALAAKAKRVIGIFILMVGAGLILESGALRVGELITLLGTLVFAWGMVDARGRASDSAAAGETVETHA